MEITLTGFAFFLRRFAGDAEESFGSIIFGATGSTRCGEGDSDRFVARKIPAAIAHIRASEPSAMIRTGRFRLVVAFLASKFCSNFVSSPQCGQEIDCPRPSGGNSMWPPQWWQEHFKKGSDCIASSEFGSILDAESERTESKIFCGKI